MGSEKCTYVFRWHDKSCVIRGGLAMSVTYKKIEMVGTSPVSFSEAVKSAIAEASHSMRHMSWFEVVEQRGRIKEGKVAEYQVVLQIGCKMGP
jgi:flavin-binding protein dodecin